MVLFRMSCDLEVFSQFKSGDELAFRQIFDQYQPLLHAKVRQFCKDQCEAEEVTQEAFVQLYLKRSTIEGPEGIYPFLQVVAKRMAVTLFRKYIVQQNYRQELQHVWKEEHTNLEQEVLYNDLHRILQETIRQLPPQQQLVYRMNKLEQLSSAEIAKHIGLSKNTVRNHLNMACRFVRFRLEKIIGMICFFILFY
ncbi:RNA polymerase sigma factor [Sphingobacterium gobiense]|uniref:RNA polymerase sigma-70 factor n=1 Tax=Sphingobacterium gobiense TaxID=1382456 RepID=A0A2S9JS42_9SPHI|nr:sigma-70 family RNA polymerase sigma factor [Sphingobacterium gobiense]PRD56064.1 hypothetical protein C5749_01890 [Sphingobacterium gobiense]